MTTAPLPPSGLVGRRREREALERVVAGVLAGESRVLVLRGEAGVGKTALLGHLATTADGCRIARAAGVEAEMELPFAGLHALCAPMLDRLEHLPVPQREALGTAFGLDAGPPPDRFLVGLAVLSLMADAAEEQPLVCIVDDAHWLDRVSAQTLAFVARRLLAERVGMVFALRDGDEDVFDGLPRLTVGGLAVDEARRLLAATLPGPLDERVQARILGEAGGNPLALSLLPRGLTPAAVAGGFGLPGQMPLTSRMEQQFIRQLEPLPADTHRLLLLAAAEPIGDAPLLWRAADLLDITPEAAGPAQAAGLLEVGVRVRFRHPLVRSAAYRAASAPERRAAHRALADATDPDLDPDRRAWHRAHAASGPDEDLASELERSAERARGRGGVAAAAAFMARATELTPESGRRGMRALAAAQAKFDAAAADSALELLSTAAIARLDDLQRARVDRLRGQIVFARTRGSEAPALLLDAARRLEAVDVALARETYLEALRASIFVGRLGDTGTLEDAAEAARSVPPGHPPRPIDLLLDGLATRFTEGYEAGVPPLRSALDAFWLEDAPSEDDKRWLWLACPVAPEPVAPDLWDDATWDRLTTHAVTLARDSGALTALPVALTYRATVHVHAGEFATAAALIDEADAISEATGNAPLPYTSLLLSAWRGQETQASRLIEADIHDANARGEGRAIGLAECARAVLYNGLGRYEDARAAAQRACVHDDLGFLGWALVELVEAAARSGMRELATSASRRLEERTRVAGTDWALGIQARSHALLADDGEADVLYREAIERLGRTRIVVHRARAHLLYGEWLRRGNRRTDAREHLRIAYETFARIGAEAFAERARRELLATGETVRRLTSETRDALTHQEAQIARLAADGKTNPEIGARLFISPRTVEYHLRKVFRKLDVTTRRDLGDALAGTTELAVSGAG